ncbi:MAG: FtsX-like permease family protein [Vicinamibacteria bacterium]
MLRVQLLLALKVLRRRPFFTAVSLVGIGLTLLVLTVAAAIFDHAFAATPPETRLDRTLLVSRLELAGEHWTSTSSLGYRFVDRYLRGLPGVERMAVASEIQGGFSYVGGERVRSYLKRTDADFWRILSFSFVEGGPFGHEDVAEGRRVAVVNEATRGRLFGGQPALGRTVELDGERYRVVGVVRDVPLLRVVPFADVWVPFTAQASDDWRQGLQGSFTAILLAGSPGDFPRIRAELASRVASVDFAGTNFTRAEARALTLFETFAALLRMGRRGTDAGAQLVIATLLALAVGFMVLPVVNLVNLNVSRALERASEIGVRRAFGASRATLVRQLVVENVVVTLVGGLAALAATEGALRLLTASALVAYADFHVNLRVFAWGLAFAVVFGILSGAWPAWRLSRLHPVEALRGGAR